MAERQQSLVLAAIIALLAVLGAVLFLGTAEDPERREADPAPAEGGAVPEPRVEPLVPLERELAASVATTVLWPLEVELELVRASLQPQAEGLPQLGSGRTAILRGRVTDRRGEGVPVTVTFAEGANRGRVLTADSTGSFGATDLYPGLCIVEVAGPGIPGARRERILRQNVEALLNIGYGLPASVGGRVEDVEGEPIAGVRVSIDGQVTHTDLEGGFYLDRVASGRALAEVRMDGYAARRQILNLAIGRSYPSLVFVLEEEVEVGLLVHGIGAAAGPVQVHLLPANPNDQRTFPWYDVNPVEVVPGHLRVVGGLPAEHVHVRAFAPGAVTARDVQAVRLRGGPMRTIEIEMRPGPELVGRVTRDGEPVEGATVRLEAPDRVQAAAALLRQPTTYLETEIFPVLPAAVQEQVTGADGRFRFTRGAELAPWRYLTAVGPDGLAVAGRVVGPDEEVVDLALERARGGDAVLVLSLPGRTQGLSCRVTVNGAPRDERGIAPDEPLRIGDLVDGEWSLRVRWHGEQLHAEERLEIVRRADREIALPEGAILGQDREAWARAGRTYPE